jgi:hypothetical protein
MIVLLVKTPTRANVLLVKTPTRAKCLVGENTNKGQYLVGENTNKGQCLVGENTNKGCGGDEMIVLLVKTPTRATNKGWGKYMARDIAEKKIIVCNETPREGLRRQLRLGRTIAESLTRGRIGCSNRLRKQKTPRGTPKEAIKNKKKPRNETRLLIKFNKKLIPKNIGQG